MAALLLLHLAQAVGGHRWFSAYGALTAAALALAIVGGGHAGRGPRRRDALLRLRDLKLACALVALLLLPEWLEGELTTGDGIARKALLDHGIPNAATILIALYLVTALAQIEAMLDARDDR